MKGQPHNRAASTRVRALPYAYDTGTLAVVLDGVELDDGSVRPAGDGRHRVDLSTSEWQRATVRGVVRVPQELMELVVSARERDKPPLRVALAVRCKTTRLRFGAVVTREDGGVVGEHPFCVELSRDLLADQVVLTPFLVRRAEAESPEPGFAYEQGTRVASGTPWTLVIDPIAQQAGRHLDVRFTPFSASPHQHVRSAAEALYLLEVELEEPILWLNEDHVALAEVLGSTGTVGLSARVRDVIFDQIGRAVWTQLFVHAALDVDEEGETLFRWGRSVLDAMLPELLPDEEEPFTRVCALRADPSELTALLGALDVLLQRRDLAVPHLQRLLVEVVEP